MRDVHTTMYFIMKHVVHDNAKGEITEYSEQEESINHDADEQHHNNSNIYNFDIFYILLFYST